jgi:DNA-binding IclR family transcriptional regulator
MKKPQKIYNVPALERSFDILDLIRSSAYGRTATELSNLMNLPYSTTFYLLKTMERRGFLRRNGDSKKFYLGTKFISYQGNMSQSTDIHVRDTAASFLEQVVSHFKMTAHTAIRDSDEAVYIDKREPRSAYIKINTWIGQRVPLHCTAVGKSLLLLSEPKEIQTILHNTKLARLTERTIVEMKEFARHLQNCRKVGYTMDDREAEIEGACVAAPIIDRQNKVVAALGVSGTIYQLPPAKMHEVGEYLNSLCHEISQRLGFTGKYPGRS